MPLVGVGCAGYGVVDGDCLIAIKGAALAIIGASKVVEFGNSVSGVWGKVVIVFCGKHGVTSLSDK